MQRRTVLTLSGAALTTALAGCSDSGTDDDDGGNGGNGGGDDDPTETDTNGNGDNGNTDGGNGDDETPTDEEPSEAGELQPVSQNTDWFMDAESFSGSGQTVTDAFGAGYFTAFVFEHDGESNFIVELIDDDSGDTVDILVNQIGSVSGAVGIGLAEGEYVLDVDADGDWSIELGEPYAPDEHYGVPPASVSGQGHDVYGEVEVDGRVTVSAQHDGESNFIVRAYDEANTRGIADEIIFNELGEFEGETSVQLEGLFYITVEADGDYEIEIE